MKGLIRALALVAVCATGARAQEGTHVVYGRVVDDSTGAPVQGADVRVGLASSTTGVAGRFRVCRILPGPASVRAKASQYEETAAAADVSHSDSTEVVVRMRRRPPFEGVTIRLWENWSGGQRIPAYTVDGERVFVDPTYCATPPAGMRLIGGMNPETIERINILKGPEAVARFGEEARAGAVLITLKPGTPRPR